MTPVRIFISNVQDEFAAARAALRHLDMIRRCVGVGLPEPEFAVTDGFVTTVRRAASRARAGGQVKGRASERAGGWRGSPAVSGAPRAQVEPYGGGQEGIPGRREQQVLADASRVGVQAGVQVGVQVELGARDAALVRTCAGAAATSRELQHAGGYAGRTRSFEQRLNRLLSAGLIEMTVPDKPRSPGQRYRLTDKGRAAIASAGNRPRRIDE